MASKFPNRAKDTKALEEGERVARARYFQRLRENAKDILSELASAGEIDDSELQDRISEEADSAVIYTNECLKILQYSDNWMAIDDVGIDPSGNFSALVCQAAYFAYEMDLSEMVEAHRDEYED